MTPRAWQKTRSGAFVPVVFNDTIGGHHGFQMKVSRPASAAESSGLFARLAKTRRNLADGLGGLLGGGGAGGRAEPDEALFEGLYDQLLLADVGVDAGERIMNRLRRDAGNAGNTGNTNDGPPADRLLESLRTVLAEILEPCERPLVINAAAKPFVILMVGVNGTGKTTTLAKLAGRLRGDGSDGNGTKVMLAACDTFRAAAIEQLQTWGRRLEVPVIAQSHGADAAAVAFDAHNAARARGMDVLLIDTAGRQHTHGDLMEQLKKIKRVLRKVDAAVPHETLLTVDAGNGYNALSQVEHFQAAVGLDGLCVTKLDGTAKGGVVVALAERFGLPIRYLGTGQEAADLRAFCAAEFAAALLPQAPRSVG